MPSSLAARVRLPPWNRSVFSMCTRSTSASAWGWWRRPRPAPSPSPPPPPTPPAAPPSPPPRPPSASPPPPLLPPRPRHRGPTPISATPAPAQVRRQVLDGFPYLTRLPGPRRRQELLQRFPQQHVLTHQPDLVAYARRDGGQVIQVHGLRDDMLGAKLHGARPRRNVSLIGEENDGALPGP